MIKNKSFFVKLFYWEYWPTYMFYVPLIPYYLYSAIKARNLVFYLATNPAIKYSGNGTESKFATIQLIPAPYKPQTLLISTQESYEEVLAKIKESTIQFPLIAKPDIGFRGLLVKKIDSERDLKVYLQKNNVETIIQEFINYDNECGIFYHRIPGEDHGKITSITLKKFLTVVGDGNSTLSELIQSDERASLYYNKLYNIHGEKLNDIPKEGLKLKLSVIGNHSQGTQFINGNHLITKDLEKILDRLSKKIDNWYYGRLDIKYNTFEKLVKGEELKVLEINGIIAEPTHIYDASTTTYFGALKIIKQHWKAMNTIARKNNKMYNVAYPKFIPYIKDMLWLRRYSKKIIRLNKLNY